MKYYLSLFVLIFLAGCAAQEPKMLSYEESRLRDAKSDCIEDANAIVDPPHSSFNIHWDNYFTMCMKTRYGYTTEQLRKMHY